MKGILLVLLCGAVAFAQPPKIDLSPKLLLQVDRAKPGSTVEAALLLDIKHPLHINAVPPSSEDLIPTTWEAEKSNAYKFEKVTFPPGKLMSFSFTSGEQINVYEGKVAVRFQVVLDPKAKLGDLKVSGKLGFQACNDSVCFPPNNETITAKLKLVADPKGAVMSKDPVFAVPVQKAPMSEPTGKQKEAGLVGTVQELYESGQWPLYFGVILLMGLGLNLTPCVFPLIPITVGFFSSQSHGSRSLRFGLAATYALTMAMVYAVLGAVAGLAGKAFGFQLQNPIVTILLCAIIVALALSMFGLYRFQPPQFLMQKVGAKSGLFGAVAMGSVAGIAAAPCVGPVVVALLAIIAASNNAVFSFFTFLALGLGLGLPFFIMGLYFEKLQGKLPKSGGWMLVIERIFGVMMIGVAIFFLQGLLRVKFGADFVTWTWFAFAAAFAVYFLVADRSEHRNRGVLRAKQSLSMILAAFAVYVGYSAMSEAPGIVWDKYDSAKIEKAMQEGKPVLIDFDASWCLACRELEKFTYTDNQVMAEASRFVKLKMDGSVTTPEYTEAAERFKVQGLPTVIFIGPDGKELEQLRLTGYEPASAFLERLRQVPNS